MNYTKPRTFSAAVAMLVLLSAPAVHAGLMYRYINDQGNVVIDYQVPASDIKTGYEIVNEEGVVLRVIPRELTADQCEHSEEQHPVVEAAGRELSNAGGGN